MAKNHNKKPNKPKYSEIIINGLIDLIVGTLLIIIVKLWTNDVKVEKVKPLYPNYHTINKVPLSGI